MLRKMLLPCENFSAYPLATSRRLLRRKRAVADYDTNQAPTAEVPSLRAGGMPAAPDTSLDKIRKEILLMRAEKSKRGGGSLDNAPSAPHAEGQLKHVDWDMWLDKIRPNEAYYKGSDVLHCVEAKDCVAKLQFFLDAHEVLRGKTEENTLRYMQAVYGAIGSAHRQDVKEYVDGLLGMVDREVQQINECLQPSTCADYSSAEKSGCALVEDTKRMAWVNTLTRMTDDEIRKLWKLGILDFDTIEHLALADATFPEDGETCEGAPAGSISDERCARRSENDSMETNDEFSTALPNEENIGILKDVKGRG
ncbi:unnamed protein product [Trypanosoma congolense IL3000]|uniref:WGS project CAEQ00000000 data, annotated contig 665 n=1 Tax=Trypanosoma congolense (strain IL3000) TaxID=1068625 RepID=F9WHL3_TRYCI|nr:unnamed protein product [Trypanosoma congolense IL3000]